MRQRIWSRVTAVLGNALRPLGPRSKVTSVTASHKAAENTNSLTLSPDLEPSCSITVELAGVEVGRRKSSSLRVDFHCL